MTDDDLELAILEAFITHYEDVRTKGIPAGKCAFELDMGEVIHKITGADPPQLDRVKERWFDQLVSVVPLHGRPLNPCSDSTVNKGPHRWRARAYASDVLGQNPRAAWQRVGELRRLMGKASAGTQKEREQKFGILLSPGQASRDFDTMTGQALEWGNPVAIVFVDLDHFKALNERWTHAKVDQTILPEAQRLLARLVQGRGEAYRHGGEEFLLIMLNLDVSEAQAFGEKVRIAFENHCFEIDGETVKVTVSVGVALWPVHGDAYQEVLEAANRAEVEAKERRNSVTVAQPGIGIEIVGDG